MSRFRNWVLTNNYKDVEPIPDEELKEFLHSLSDIRYYIFQLEKGENETLHHQIYISFEKVKRFDYLKKRFPRAHIENMKGNPEQAKEYCSKEDTRINEPIEYGELPPYQGKRNDFVDILDLINDGITLDEIMISHPSHFFRYHDKLVTLRNHYLKRKYGSVFRKMNVVYLSDVPGSGKTRYIAEKYGYNNVYKVTDYKHPFDAYDGQEVLVFEEFRNDLPLKDMLHYLDGHPCELRARYSNRTACYTKVYIISNWDFKEQYTFLQENDKPSYDAFKRRIHHVGDLKSVKQYDLSMDEELPF